MKRYLLILAAGLFIVACQPKEPVYLYEVNEVEVSSEGVQKNNLKGNLEFISLAYTDLFDQTIPQNQLQGLVQAYDALGDKDLIADILIRNMLNSPQAKVPTDQEMRSNPEQFVRDTYKRFYIREPSAYETWFFVDMINDDPQVTATMIYYAFLTSDEYRYF